MWNEHCFYLFSCFILGFIFLFLYLMTAYHMPEASFIIAPHVHVFKCCCMSRGFTGFISDDKVIRWAVKPHLESISHREKMQFLLSMTKQERLTWMLSSGWFEVGDKEFRDSFENRVIFHIHQ